VKTLMAELARKGLAKNSLRIIHATLRTIFNAAVEEGLLTVNPALRAWKFGRNKTNERTLKPLTAAEISDFLTTVQQSFPRYYGFFLTLARTGIRVGEARGLQWADIDYNGGLITVRRTLHGKRIETPKSGQTRQVDMSKQLAHVLRSSMQQRREDAMKRGLGKVPEWVFCTPDGQPLDDFNLRRRIFYPALLKAGVRRIRIHDLRHGFATMLIQNGEGLAYVRDQLGHHSIQITVDTYGHLMPSGNRKAVDALDDSNWKSGSRMVATDTSDSAGGKDNVSEVGEKDGATRQNRTGDLLITNQLLYQLS
jgi:integrase